MVTFEELETARKNIETAGFVWDPTWNGYERWTHKSKSVTCLRQPWMSDTDFVKHIQEKIEEADRVNPEKYENKVNKLLRIENPPVTDNGSKITLASRSNLDYKTRLFDKNRYQTQMRLGINPRDYYQYEAGKQFAKNMHEREGFFFEESGSNWSDAYANGYFDYAISVKKKQR